MKRRATDQCEVYVQVIAIETATLAGSIAIIQEDGISSEFSLNIRTDHSERLMPSVELLLDHSGLALSDMDAIAVSIGPGSFTGLRIGLAAAKGLSYSSGKPLVGIPTLDAFAANISYSCYNVCPVLDARKGEVYTAIYKAGSLLKLTEDMVVSPSSLRDIIKERTIFIGDGVRTYGRQLKDMLGDFFIEAPVGHASPRASNVAALAIKRLHEGDIDNVMTLIPSYVRRSEAEIKWKG